MHDKTQVKISALGSKGDGIIYNGEKQYIKNALPGEDWVISPNGIPQRLFDSPDRVVAPCKHFGQCGGCVAQHMHMDLYTKWKLSIIAEAFNKKDLYPEIKPLRLVSQRSRRRASLGIERSNGNVVIGFREEKRNTLVDISDCIVLDKSIVEILPALKQIAKISVPENSSGKIIITKLDAGLDVVFQNGFKQIQSEEQAEIFHIIENKPIIRLVVSGDTILYRAHSRLVLGGIEVEIPPTVFVQPVQEAEQIMVDLVLNAFPKKTKHVCDLFCGIGTFTFHIAKKFGVFAFDNDRRAITVLQEAAKRAQGLKPVQSFVRDLFREPLSPKELNNFDVVLIDPPRVGAAQQFQQLARSKVPFIIAVSCSPSSLARDARVLIDAGYQMEAISPIDQFIYSSHLELITVFKNQFE